MCFVWCLHPPREIWTQPRWDLFVQMRHHRMFLHQSGEGRMSARSLVLHSNAYQTFILDLVGHICQSVQLTGWKLQELICDCPFTSHIATCYEKPGTISINSHDLRSVFAVSHHILQMPAPLCSSTLFFTRVTSSIKKFRIFFSLNCHFCHPSLMWAIHLHNLVSYHASD